MAITPSLDVEVDVRGVKVVTDKSSWWEDLPLALVRAVGFIAMTVLLKDRAPWKVRVPLQEDGKARANQRLQRLVVTIRRHTYCFIPD